MNIKKGMTLVEVLIAIAILSTGILTWTITQGTNVKNRNMSGRMSRGVEIAQSSCESLSSTVSEWDTNGSDYERNSTLFLDNITYTIFERAIGNQVVSDGKSVWSIRISVEWTRYAKKSINIERLVIGQ